ncbi:MAG: YggT family protein [Litoreibacter sp.]|nr:YggT family protein [Litoreibacter sp.]MCY4337090.1 YggT family protein [Litoreibacter sp.]
MSEIAFVLQPVFSVIKTIIFIYFIMSWLLSFQVLNLRQPLVAQIWNGLTTLLEPLFRPIRNILPATGGLDFSPLVVLLIILMLERLLFVI